MASLSWLAERRRVLILTAIPVALAAIIFFWAVGSRSAQVFPVSPKIGTGGEPQRAPSQPEDIRSLTAAPSPEFKRDASIYNYSATSGDLNITALPPINNRVIKTASLTVKVKKRGFSRAFDKAALIAEAGGGYIAGSNSSSTEGDIASGTVIVRIPAGAFEKVITELKGIGKVKTLDIQSQDVSQEYVDLESRLRHWRSQESILLGLMEKAQTIADSIAIQNQLSQVQQQIEEITGRLNFLKNQTDMSTIQMTITETGVVPKPADRWGFRTALSQAAHAFVDTINGFVIVIGYTLPLGLIAVIIYSIYSILRRRLAGGTATAI